MWQNLKDQIVTKLRNSNCAKLTKKLWQLKNSNCDSNKNDSSDRSSSNLLVKNTLTPWQPTTLRAAFCNSCDVFLLSTQPYQTSNVWQPTTTCWRNWDNGFLFRGLHLALILTDPVKIPCKYHRKSSLSLLPILSSSVDPTHSGSLTLWGLQCKSWLYLMGNVSLQVVTDYYTNKPACTMVEFRSEEEAAAAKVLNSSWAWPTRHHPIVIIASQLLLVQNLSKWGEFKVQQLWKCGGKNKF